MKREGCGRGKEYLYFINVLTVQTNSPHGIRAARTGPTTPTWLHHLQLRVNRHHTSQDSPTLVLVQGVAKAYYHDGQERDIRD